MNGAERCARGPSAVCGNWDLTNRRSYDIMAPDKIRVGGKGTGFLMPIPNLNNSIVSAAKAATVATGILCQSRTLILSIWV